MSFSERIDRLSREIQEAQPQNAAEAEGFRLSWLGRKGAFAEVFEQFKTVSPEEKRAFGQVINELKRAAEERIASFKITFTPESRTNAPRVDLTRPVALGFGGSRHPVSLTMERITGIFRSMGFGISEGPEIEDDWHNFSALNFPEEHPARDMQDTFFVATDPMLALRTHTSSVQVRAMESQTLPIRTISPGRVFRNEAISSRSHCIFHQVEGLYIDKDVSFADLKQTLLTFARELFGANTEIRLRPSYFPFTEPSAEMDVWWGLETEADHRITKGTGWLEILGCGMLDPQVLLNCGIDPEVYSGFAFGIGIERIAMNLFGVTDLRWFFESDVRFVGQFGV
ncbi:phenylalanine--tRNA ligase subunit alpha [bacterium]|nr:phenylalanine--tRNA ligase subunit alpha [bacterium]